MRAADAPREPEVIDPATVSGREDAEGAEPSIRPVTWGTLAVALSVGALAGSVAKVALEEAAGAAPAPVAAGVPLVLLAGLLVAIARAARTRIQVNREPVTPELALRWLAFSRTGLIGGATLGGFFLFWALGSVGAWDAPLGRSRVAWSVVAVLGAAALTGAGRYLERQLLVPPPPDDGARA